MGNWSVDLTPLLNFCFGYVIDMLGASFTMWGVTFNFGEWVAVCLLLALCVFVVKWLAGVAGSKITALGNLFSGFF